MYSRATIPTKPSPVPHRDLGPFLPGERTLSDILPPIANLAVSERPEEGLYVVNLRGSAVVYQVFPESYRMIIRPGAFEPPFASSEEAEDWVVSHLVSRAEMQWDPTPRAGDLAHFSDGRRGVIDSAKYPGDLLQVCLNWSAFRAVLHVSCSGGPVPAVRKEDLSSSRRFLGIRPSWDRTRSRGFGIWCGGS